MSQELCVFVIKQAGVGIATMGDLKTNAKQTVAATKDARIYLLSDGKPVAGLINLKLMALLEELLEDEEIAKTVSARLAAVETGADALMDAEAFFSAAERNLSGKAAPKVARRKAALGTVSKAKARSR